LYQEDEMSVEQQIEELRAELSWCDDAGERRQIEAELRAAEKRLKRCNRALRQAEQAGWQ
jgi:primosomal protein N''|tara:strand:- start:18808 stop:18987 length:180 start_codon:yes stop_codon:yes gene_type:complete